MKLRDVLTKAKNRSNNQTIWNPRKRELKRLNLSEEDLLNIKLDKNILGDLK